MRIFLIISLLIIYGSLYPGDFSTTEPDALNKFLSDWQWMSSLGDMLGNVALFIPFGLVCTFAAGVGFQSIKRLTYFFIFGFLLALILQFAQIWLPTRSASLADVVWNVVGMLLGIFIGLFIRRYSQTKTLSPDIHRIIPVTILILWLLVELIPLVPTLDVQKFKDALKPLFQEFDIAIPLVLLHAAGVLAAASIVKIITNHPVAWLTTLVLIVVAGKVVIISLELDFTTLLGLVTGYLICIACFQFKPTALLPIGFWLLLLGWTVERLTPFSIASDGILNLIPFATMLKGSMQTSAAGLAQSLFIYSALLWLIQKMEGDFKGIVIAIVAWSILIELIQMLLLGRTADITEPILVILVAWVFAEYRRYTMQINNFSVPVSKPYEVENTFDKTVSINPRSENGLLLGSITLMITITFAIWFILRLPGIPYNLKELFHGDGHFLFIFIFLQVLVWVGVGAAWVSNRVALSKTPHLALPFWSFLACLVSLLLLSLSVTEESIGDIAGSTNLYWFVTNRDIWGESWRHIFLWVGPEIVSFLERPVRFAALYTPLVIFLSLLILFKYELKKPDRKQTILIITSAVLWLWLAKAIAFDWSSTDNLNELIARDGPMGWGGGGYLYALLILLCFNAVMFTKGSYDFTRWILNIIFSLVALPIGWLLLSNGLESEVEKYGSVFSGAQFLLGPDRRQILPETELFARWCLVQIGFVIVVSIGIRIFYHLKLRHAKNHGIHNFMK